MTIRSLLLGIPAWVIGKTLALLSKQKSESNEDVNIQNDIMENENLLKQIDVPNKTTKQEPQDLNKELEKVAEALDMPDNERRRSSITVDVKTTNAESNTDQGKSLPSNTEATLEKILQMQERLQKEILDLKSIIKGHSQQATK